jgi:DNA topoisomerase-1
LGSQTKPSSDGHAVVGRARLHSAKRRVIKRTPPDPAEAAEEAGLTYTTDVVPGIRRVRKGKGFVYRDPAGKLVRDAATLNRIQSLVIPPAWKHVWITTHPRGHLQATGRDARGRKQPLYHPRWRVVRDANKFDRMVGFARKLPRIRRRVARDMRRDGLPKEKVVATVVRLLELTFARIGNEEYARENRSFGLTTLRDRHVDVSGATIRFLFMGKSGREVQVALTNKRVARVVKRCEDLPGQMLFQYLDDHGERHVVTSDDVNQYLQDATGEDYTAKDFRTWAGTVLAATALRELVNFESETEARRNVISGIDSVARKLGHTRAVCRRAYVHPAVIEAYMDRSLEDALKGNVAKTFLRLKADESAVVALLKRSMVRKGSKGKVTSGRI